MIQVIAQALQKVGKGTAEIGEPSLQTTAETLQGRGQT